MFSVIFPGQGSQIVGMGKEFYDKFNIVKDLFNQADETLNFPISKLILEGPKEELDLTANTQPAIFLHSTILSEVMADRFHPEMVAGHSLGEFSALVSTGVLSFKDGLNLVRERALAMQSACEQSPGTMAAILGLEDSVVESVCESTPGIVIAANYNCPNQLVISGSKDAIDRACNELKEAGAKRALVLPVGGAFHSPLMEPAKKRLAAAIENTVFKTPSCAVYQNVCARGIFDSDKLKANLISQLTAPVYWTQTIKQMILDGATHFTEVGPGKVLQGLVKNCLLYTSPSPRDRG